MSSVELGRLREADVTVAAAPSNVAFRRSSFKEMFSPFAVVGY
jgi:hypothetical protein